jgi:hypothetical protein
MMRRAGAAMALGAILAALPASAQDHAQHQTPAPSPDGWQWHAEGTAFFGFNYQHRKFTDFDVWESQNWIMGSGERSIGTSRLRVTSMLSFEPFTLRDIGSPQVFQTGETFRRAALVDYQHPHDFLMGLGAELRMPAGRVMTILGADIVGSPTLGPPIFMHRPSAAENPQAPLSHHHLDSTHITPGVIRGGIEVQGIKLEASVFQGREPDEDRLDLDLGTLDSYATRLSFTRGAWYAQASAGWLTKPEVVTPYDATRLTASIAYTRGDERRAIAWMAAFGQNREIHGNLEAYMVEATLRTSVRDSFYTRVEAVAKDILDVGFHPVNTFHRHRQSQVGAATLGYVLDVWRSPIGAFGLGADVTGYRVPANLQEAYGRPWSWHAFVRYRGRAGAPTAAHVH